MTDTTLAEAPARPRGRLNRVAGHVPLGKSPGLLDQIQHRVHRCSNRISRVLKLH
jgi:hypothetical protein